MDHHGWDERYASSDLVWSATPNRFLPPIAERLEVGRALDVACGEGRNAIWLAATGWDVTAVDFSTVGIDKGRRMADDLGIGSHIEWVAADVTTYGPTDLFDLVMVFYLHLEPESFTEAARRAVGAVAAGGTFVAVGHAVRNLTDGVGGPQVAEILWTTDLFEPLLRGFEVVELGERLRPVDGSDVDAIDFIAHAVRL